MPRTPKRRARRRGETEASHAPVPPPLSDRVLTWDEVRRTHRIQNGVYQRHGRLVSLLTDFGRIHPCYPDVADTSGETISYTGEGRHGDQHLSPGNRALLAAIESGHAVPLFNKLEPGRWQHMGFWRVVEAAHLFDARERRMLWRFTLRRARVSRRAMQADGSPSEESDENVKPL